MDRGEIFWLLRMYFPPILRVNKEGGRSVCAVRDPFEKKGVEKKGIVSARHVSTVKRS